MINSINGSALIRLGAGGRGRRQEAGQLLLHIAFAPISPLTESRYLSLTRKKGPGRI